MNKGIIVVLLTVIIITTVIYRTIFVKHSGVLKTPLSSSNNNQLTRTIEKKLKEYIDPSGFKFNYPENLKVSSQESKNQAIYSSLEITSSTNPGKIAIKLEDSSIATIDAYLKTQKILNSKKIKIADLDGRQYDNENQLTTIALDNGVLISIVVDYKKEKSFWQDVNNKIVSSFSFYQPQTQQSTSGSSTSSGGEDVIDEGEEIVE